MLGFERARPRPQLFEKMDGRGIEQGVNGVETKTVEMVIAQPHQRVVAEEAADFVGCRRDRD